MHAVITVFPLFRFSVSHLTNNLCQPRCGEWNLVPYLHHLFISFCFIFRLVEFPLKFEQKPSYKIPHLQFLPSYIPYPFSILFLFVQRFFFFPFLPSFMLSSFFPSLLLLTYIKEITRVISPVPLPRSCLSFYSTLIRFPSFYLSVML